MVDKLALVDLLGLNTTLVMSLFPLLVEEWLPHLLVLKVPVDESWDLVDLDVSPNILLAHNKPNLLEWTNRILIRLTKAVALPIHWVPELHSWIWLAYRA